jgi:hypothetical protein
VSPGSRDYCATIPALPAEPVIDGELDCGLELASIGTNWNGDLPVPSDHGAEYAVAWRPDGLYFFVRVRDPDRLPPAADVGAFCGDSVELFVHHDGTPEMAPLYSSPGTGQFIVAAPVDAQTISRRAELYVMALMDWSSDRVLAFPLSDGYAVEGFFTATDLKLASWALAAEDVVGIDVSLNVSWPDARQGDCGTRQGQYVLRRAPDDTGPASNVNAFCFATLESLRAGLHDR